MLDEMTSTLEQTDINDVTAGGDDVKCHYDVKCGTYGNVQVLNMERIGEFLVDIC